MRAVTIATLLLACACVVQAAPAVLPDATTIVCSLPKALVSGGPKVGDQVPLLVRDTVYDAAGQTLVASGAAASGTVTASQGAKRLLRSGKLDFVPDYVTAVDGRRIVVRGMQQRGGPKVGIAARLGISLLFRPLLLLKGKDITFPSGMQFAVYVDGEQKVETSAVPEAPRHLTTTGFLALPADAGTALYALTVTNPNHQHGLLGAALITTVLDAAGKPIGTNSSPNPAHPQQVMYALRPDETRTLVKQVSFSGGYAKTVVHLAQPWQSWEEAANPEQRVPILYSEWKGDRTITGMVRNPNSTALQNLEIAVTVRRGGELAALGVVNLETLAAGSNYEFKVQLTGPAAVGTPYEIYAYGQLPPGRAQ